MHQSYGMANLVQSSLVQVDFCAIFSSVIEWPINISIEKYVTTINLEHQTKLHIRNA